MRPGVNLSNMTNCPVLPIKLLPPTCTHSCENRTKTIMYYDDFLGSIRQFGDGGFHLFGGFHLLSLVISKRIQSLARKNQLFASLKSADDFPSSSVHDSQVKPVSGSRQASKLTLC